jgi:hypothetical protein
VLCSARRCCSWPRWRSALRSPESSFRRAPFRSTVHDNPYERSECTLMPQGSQRRAHIVAILCLWSFRSPERCSCKTSSGCACIYPLLLTYCVGPIRRWCLVNSCYWSNPSSSSTQPLSADAAHYYPHARRSTDTNACASFSAQQ